jgi:hypothetical protein
MKSQIMLTFVMSIFLLLSCGQKDKQTIGSHSDSISSINQKNHLTMKINGKEWSADHDVFGAFHPKGYDKVIIIAGASGKKDKSEKAFNINIYQTSGPGQFSFANGNAALSVAQMGNWTEQEYLCGSMMGFDMKVHVTKASSYPHEVEATFSGTMSCPSGAKLTITEGKFYYHE